MHCLCAYQKRTLRLENENNDDVLFGVCFCLGFLVCFFFFISVVVVSLCFFVSCCYCFVVVVGFLCFNFWGFFLLFFLFVVVVVVVVVVDWLVLKSVNNLCILCATRVTNRAIYVKNDHQLVSTTFNVLIFNYYIYIFV